MVPRILSGTSFMVIAVMAQQLYNKSQNVFVAGLGIIWATTAIVILGSVLWDAIRGNY